MADEHLLLRSRPGDDDAHYLIGQAGGVTYRRSNKSESSLRIPPAYIITDSDGAVWTFGFEYNTDGEINVLCNDVDVDQFAQFIEYRLGRVWLFGRAGWRHLSRDRQHFI